MSLRVYYEVLNQRGTPALFTDTLANRPAFGFQGRLFFSTDTGQIFEDTGTAWTVIADAGAGTTGTLQQVTTNGNTTTNGIVVQGININDGAGTGLDNTGVGRDVLNANTTGTRNTAIGYASLNLNTTGFDNSGIGYSSLALNTIGQGNTAIGYASLNANTTGSNNTAIGRSALINNTTADGNTAIGTNSSRSNTTGVNNNAVGLNSLRFNTTGGNNNAIGTNALQNNTTASDNTAIGNNSLNANTTGANNTAIGSSALITNTTASFNTAIGGSSLSANTTGTQNTAIGYLSLSANITGNQNVAIGNNALQNSTASQNTAIGSSSLITNTTGANNTAIGNQSMQLNTTGQQNTAIGSGSLANNTTANFNTAIGTSSLGANTTGALNTAIGVNAGLNNTSGSNNNYIGTSSGTGITTGSNNTIIGNAGTLSSTLSNNIILADGNGNIRYQFDGTNNVFGGNIITPQVRASTSAGLSINANSGTQVADFGAGGSANITFFGGLSGTSASFTGAVQGSAYRLTGMTAGSGALYWTSDRVTMANYNVGGSLTFEVNGGAEAMRITNGNNVLVGNTISYHSALLQVAGKVFYGSTTGVDYGGTIYGWNDTSRFPAEGGLKFQYFNYDGSSYAMRDAMTINGVGNVSIGTTINTGKLRMKQSADSHSNTFTIENFGNTNTITFLIGSDNNFYLGYNGTSIGVTNSSTGIYTPLSDINKKKDFELSTIGLNAILGLKPTLFRMKSDKTEGNKELGFIAQEVKNYIPEAYVESKNFIGLNYNAIVAALVKSVQELKAEIEELKAKFN
jgi:hypothetical protein